LKEYLGKKWGDIAYLLGGWTSRTHWRTGKPIHGYKDKWRANVPDVRAVIYFL
jgi:hypothetical protein